MLNLNLYIVKIVMQDPFHILEILHTLTTDAQLVAKVASPATKQADSSTLDLHQPSGLLAR